MGEKFEEVGERNLRRVEIRFFLLRLISFFVALSITCNALLFLVPR